MQRYHAYGAHLSLAADTPALLELAGAALPRGWSPLADDAPADRACAALRIAALPDQTYQLWIDSGLAGVCPTVDQLRRQLSHHAELLMAEHATTHLFVHAGVVGWQGRAIVIPGRSFSGKTTLVAALVAAGAAYYSDEFAILDPQGLVYPYPRPLAVRTADGQPLPPIEVERLGGSAGTQPIPVGLVIVTRFDPTAAWRPAAITPGQSLLALMDNTVAARRNPAHSMPILRQVALNARSLQSPRGDAAATAASLLSTLEGSAG